MELVLWIVGDGDLIITEVSPHVADLGGVTGVPAGTNTNLPPCWRAYADDARRVMETGSIIERDIDDGGWTVLPCGDGWRCTFHLTDEAREYVERLLPPPSHKDASPVYAIKTNADLVVEHVSAALVAAGGPVEWVGMTVGTHPRYRNDTLDRAALAAARVQRTRQAWDERLSPHTMMRVTPAADHGVVFYLRFEGDPEVGLSELMR